MLANAIGRRPKDKEIEKKLRQNGGKKWVKCGEQIGATVSTFKVCQTGTWRQRQRKKNEKRAIA